MAETLRVQLEKRGSSTAATARTRFRCRPTAVAALENSTIREFTCAPPVRPARSPFARHRRLIARTLCDGHWRTETLVLFNAAATLIAGASPA
jgi:hypothetical protein